MNTLDNVVVQHVVEPLNILESHENLVLRLLYWYCSQCESHYVENPPSFDNIAAVRSLVNAYRAPTFIASEIFQFSSFFFIYFQTPPTKANDCRSLLHQKANRQTLQRIHNFSHDRKPPSPIRPQRHKARRSITASARPTIPDGQSRLGSQR